MGRIIGIDLGTTTSEIAYLKDGIPTIVKNIEENNSVVIPSVVSIEGEEIRVGNKAKNKLILNPENTICEVKRKMGNIERISIGGREYLPQQISAMILRRLKEIAEFSIGDEVDEAVITVPANFNESQRKATKEAGEIAGFKVERIINEPTAAALAYGIDNMENCEKILVYDFGGGTFDVSILEIFDGIMDVKASRGNNSLGGKDIDRAILKLIIDKFYMKNSTKIDLKNKRIKNAIISAAKEGKENLSFEEETEIIVPYVAIDENNNPVDLDVIIKRNDLEERIRPIIDSTNKVIDDVLNGAKVNESDIDKVILVGGTTRIPYVKTMINNRFPNKIVNGVNPEEAVALGAAIQGAIKRGEMEEHKDIILTDSASYTLGVEILNGVFDSIINRDTKLPAMVKKKYHTVEDNQDVVEIRVYQGESKFVKDNNFLGSFEIGGIPKGKKGEEIIEITFKYDLNGLLDVLVSIISTGKIISEKIDIGGLTKEEIDFMRTEFEENRVGEKDNRDLIKNAETELKLEENHYEEIAEKSTWENNSDELEHREKIQEDINKENNQEKLDEEDKIEEEYTLEEFYHDVGNLVAYYNNKAPSLEIEVKKKASELMQDLLALVKAADHIRGKAVANEIVNLICED